MSSRQFTPFGGSGEIVTLDNINEYDDLPPLAEIDSPDVYEIRTGALGTDYLVPMQDGSTDFNEWYSLVDGQIIRAIPDSENLHAHYEIPLQPESDSEVIDPLIDKSGNGHDADAVGEPTMDESGLNSTETAILDGDDYWEIGPSDWGTISPPITVYAGFELRAEDLDDDYRLFWSEDDSDNWLFGSWDDSEFWRLGTPGDDVDGTSDDSIQHATFLFDDTNGESELFEERTSTATAGDADQGEMDRLTIGNRTGFSEEWVGAYSILLVYDTRHDDEMRQDVWDHIESVLNI